MYLEIVSSFQEGCKFDLEPNRKYVLGSDFNGDIYVALNDYIGLVGEFYINDDGEIFFTQLNVDVSLNNGGAVSLGIGYSSPLVIRVFDVEIFIGMNTESLSIIKEVDPPKKVNSLLLRLKENPLLSKIIYRLNNTKIKKLLIFIMVCIVILVVAILCANLYTGDKGSYETTVTKERVQHKLNELSNRFSGVAVSERNGNVILIGMVENLKDYTEVSQKFSDISGLKNKVLIYDQVEPRVLKLLKENGYVDLHVSYDTNQNILSIKGIVDSLAQIDDIQILLNDSIDDLVPCDISKVYVLRDVEDKINKLLSDYSGKLNFQIESNIVKVGGYLNSQDFVGFESQISNIRNVYSGVVVIQTNIKNLSSALPFSISEVHNGTNPYIVTGDGKSLYVGGELNGVKLIKIEADSLTFGGSVNLKISFSDLSGGQSLNSVDASSKKLNSRELARENLIKEEAFKVRLNIEQIEQELKDLSVIAIENKSPVLESALNRHTELLTQELANLRRIDGLYPK